MKHILLLVLFVIISICALSQERIDTAYYNNLGQRVSSPVFADYYVLSIYPTDSTKLGIFKDFYLSGELRKEGHFLTIDTLDDHRMILDGEIVSYFKNGNISGKSNYSAGVLDGEYLQYDKDGRLEMHTFYVDGKLSGIHKIYREDGSCQIVEYYAGQPVHDYYLLADSNGNTLKFRISNNIPIWESPAVVERFVEYRDGVPWEVYFKNGLTIALTDAVVRDYGKWHRIDVIISNNSLTPIEFDPETDIVAYSVDEHDIATDLQVWSCDRYMKKVNRSQTWTSILLSVCEGTASAGAAYSTSATTSYSQYGSYLSTTTTYNPSAAYQANMASQQRLADFSRAMQNEQQVKKLGYLKKNTVYPGESISGFVHIEWIKGKRVMFVIRIEDAEYIYEWEFDRKSAFLLD